MLKEDLKKNKLLITFLFVLIFNGFIYLFLNPFNYDGTQMYSEIERIHNSDNSISNLLHSQQTLHPPLYFSLASLFYSTEDPRTTQIFSFICYSLTLILFLLLIKRFSFLTTRDKVILLLFFGLLPELVIQSKFISNDTLAILFGGLLFYFVWNYSYKPNIKNGILISIITALGLLTKASFVMFLPGVIFALFYTPFKKIIFSKKQIIYLIIIFILCISIGSVKYLENLKKNDNPFTGSKEYYSGFEDRYKLGFNSNNSIQTDLIIAKNMVIQIYRDFWFPSLEINPLLKENFSKVGNSILALSIIPTLLIIFGAILVIKNLRKSMLPLEKFELFSLINIMCIVFGTLFAAFWFDNRPFLQARYLLPSIFGIMIIMKKGLESSNNKEIVEYFLVILMTLFFIYLTGTILQTII